MDVDIRELEPLGVVFGVNERSRSLAE